MKTQIKSYLLGLVILTSFFTSCQKDELNPESSGLDENYQQQIVRSNELDEDTDVTVQLINSAYIEEEISQKSQGAYIPECVTKTVTVNGNTKTVVLDFGEGCEMPDGRVFSGIITLEYTLDTDAMSRSLSFVFDGFKIDQKLFSGGGSILRQWQNENGNPQSTIQVDINILWPDGAQLHRTSEKVREWIEGLFTPEWGDNVYLITGNRTTSFPDGTVNSGVVTTPLRRELSCNFIVSGVIALTHNGHTGTLDFGDGDCDNEAVFTAVDGTTHVIHL